MYGYGIQTSILKGNRFGNRPNTTPKAIGTMAIGSTFKVGPSDPAISTMKIESTFKIE